jgi:cytosine/adenosine deaminase-related metal-dependent hydrolase
VRAATSRLGAVNLAGTPTCVSEQVINIADAVYAYTMGSAYANFCEDNRGSISPGKHAELVVLSQDITMTKPRLAGRSAPSQSDDQPVRRPLIASRSIDYVPRAKVPRKNGTPTSV